LVCAFLALALALPVVLGEEHSNLIKQSNSLNGVWQGETGNGCSTIAWFDDRSFFSNNVGKGCAGRGTFAGVYTISQSLLKVQYTLAPNATNFTGLSLEMQIKLKNDTLMIKMNNSNPITFTRVPASPMDGVWNMQVVNKSTGQIYSSGRVEVIGRVVVSYSYTNALNAIAPVWGILNFDNFQHGQPVPSGTTYAGSISYTTWRGSLFGVSTPAYLEMPAYAFVANKHSGLGYLASFTLTDMPGTETRFISPVPATNLDGDYGCLSVTNCPQVVNFHNGLFRSSIYGGGKCIAGVFGTQNLVNATHFQLSYGYSNVGIDGVVADFGYTLSKGVLTVTLPPQFGGGSFQCRKAVS